MGYAYGQLYGPEIATNLNNLIVYGKEKIEGFLSKLGLSQFIMDLLWGQIEQLGFYLLDLNYQIALPYIPQRFIDEIKGIADGSNGTVSEQMIIRANMLPELTQAACTVFGAFGSATADGKLYHLRALDWEPTAEVNQYPTVIIYDSTEENSKPFANIGYMGLIGTLTAMSKIGISIGEKVMYVRSPNDYPVKPDYTYVGKPWMYVLRDTVQFSNNVEEAEQMMSSTKRTMMIHLGLGSLPDKTFRGVDYAANFIQFYNDANYTHYSGSHPQFTGVFYLDKGVQPSGDMCIASITTAQHGKITPETMFRDIAGYHETGNAQVIVMDPEGQQIWGTWSQYGAPINAYERSPIHIDLKPFWGSSSQTSFLA